MHKMDLKHRFEEFIVVFLIVLNIFDFLKLLYTDIDFMKKIISWLLLGYLIYHVSITKQVFGEKKKTSDIILIMAFFLLISRYFITFSREITEGTILGNLYNLISSNPAIFNYMLFYLGMAIILASSIYLGIRTPIKNPSFLHVIHGERIRDTFFGKMERISLIFIILISFFLFIFTPVMEWLGLAVDASLIIVAIIFYTFTSFRRHFKRFNEDDFIFKIGSFGEKFYEEFIALLHTKKGLLLISSGIICLHILSDIGNFMIPYFFGIKDFMYLKMFDMQHQSLNMMLADIIIGNDILYVIQMIILYTLNIIGITSLLILPSYVWYRFYRNKTINIKRITLTIILISINSLILTPIFHFTPIESKDFIGIDIQSYINGSDLGNNYMTIGMYLVFGILIYLMTNKEAIRKGLTATLMAITNLFLGFYAYVFFIQNSNHYISLYSILTGKGSFLIALVMILFMILHASFYILGFSTYTYENIKEIAKSR